MYFLNPSFVPRYWQTEGTDACIRTLFTPPYYDSAVRILPTGGGKGFEIPLVCMRYLNGNPDKSVFIIVHREPLVADLANRITKMISDENGNPLIPTKIIAGQKTIRPSKVYICMAYTVDNHLKKAHIYREKGLISSFQKIINTIGLIIKDEAHRGEHVNFENRIRDNHKAHNLPLKELGYTATPLTGNKKRPLKSQYQTIVTYMKNGQLITGPQISELNAWHKLHPNEGLCDYVPIIPKDGYSESEKRAIEGTKSEKERIRLDGQIGSKPKYIKAVWDLYAQQIKEPYKGHIIEISAFGTKGIIFNASIEHSMNVMKFGNDLRYNVKHLDASYWPGKDAKNRDWEREARDIDGSITGIEGKLLYSNYDTYKAYILKWLNDTPDAILSTGGDMMTTGIDIPSLRFCMLNSYVTSLGKYMQSVGRLSRPYPGKIYFLVFDMHNSCVKLGDWNVDRDWIEIFNNPEKPGNGVAPIKICPQCEGKNHASARKCTELKLLKVCPKCGFPNDDYEFCQNIIKEDWIDLQCSELLLIPCGYIFPRKIVEEPEFIDFVIKKTSIDMTLFEQKQEELELELSQIGKGIYEVLYNQVRKIVMDYDGDMDKDVAEKLFEIGNLIGEKWRLHYRVKGEVDKWTGMKKKIREKMTESIHAKYPETKNYLELLKLT